MLFLSLLDVSLFHTRMEVHDLISLIGSLFASEDHQTIPLLDMVSKNTKPKRNHYVNSLQLYCKGNMIELPSFQKLSSEKLRIIDVVCVWVAIMKGI